MNFLHKGQVTRIVFSCRGIIMFGASGMGPFEQKVIIIVRQSTADVHSAKSKTHFLLTYPSLSLSLPITLLNLTRGSFHMYVCRYVLICIYLCICTWISMGIYNSFIENYTHTFRFHFPIIFLFISPISLPKIPYLKSVFTKNFSAH